MTLKWKGDELIKKKNRAVAMGINETMAESVKQALNHHPEWQNRTLVAETSIQTKEFATSRKHEGLWGSVWTTARKRLTKKGKAHTTNYVWYLEFNHGSFLRNAADTIYPSLAKRIRKRFK